MNIKERNIDRIRPGIASPPNVFEFLSIHSQLLALANARVTMNSKVSDEVIRNFFGTSFIIFALMIKIEGVSQV